MGDIIKAPKVRLHVQPAIIDDTGTRLNMDISASFAHIAGQWVSTSCYTPEIKSLYGIYDRFTDEILYGTVFLALLLQ